MFQKPIIVLATIAMAAAAASAGDDAVVITNQSRAVSINHLFSGGCVDNQSISADSFAPFDEEIMSKLDCYLDGTDRASQSSTISTSQLAAAGSSSLTAVGVEFTIQYHLTTSRYKVTFEITSPRAYTLTGSLSAMIANNLGGYHGANAMVRLYRPGSCPGAGCQLYYEDLDAWSDPESLASDIDVQGVLEPGEYVFEVHAQNYFDLGIFPGEKIASHSEYDVVLTLGDPVFLPGDLDGSGAVDGADLATLLGAWGACGDCEPPADCPADLDDTCAVDGADLAILLGNWG